MTKEILATNIDGLLIKHEAFIKPHELWFDRAISLTGNASFAEYKGRKDYFKGVDKVMKILMPQATEKERTEQARKWYQEDTITYIKFHPGVINTKTAEFFRKLKKKFVLALVTTNTEEYINQILEASNLTNIYDIVFASSLKEKPDKASLFGRFVKKYGKPKFYIASNNRENFEQCHKLGSLCIYFALDEFNPEIEKLADKTARTEEELESLLES
jgi:phosphoglycolate phosphatase-like HAD superfamily hydrolase